MSVKDFFQDLAPSSRKPRKRLSGIAIRSGVEGRAGDLRYFSRGLRGERMERTLAWAEAEVDGFMRTSSSAQRI